MSEALTMEEIEAAYPDEWVLIAEPELDDWFDVLGGVVVFHSTDRAAVWQRDRELKLRSAAVLFMGAPIDPAYDGAILQCGHYS